MGLKIKIKNEHKSLKQIPCEFELPDFTVLTGINGSGKTHLLEAISLNSANQKSEIFYNGNKINNIKYVPYNGLNPNIQGNADENTITQYVKQIWQQFLNQRNARQATNQTNTQFISRFHDEKQKKYIEKVITKSGKNLSEINEDDFNDYFEISFMGSNDFFTAQFALIFKDYHKKYEENNYNAYCKANDIPYSRTILSDEEFINTYGKPPWDFVNKILDESNIPYEVNNPMGTRKETSFIFKLIDKKDKFEINATDLSTGEKVLMSLALAIYNTENSFGAPELLIIDEPDAALHPSMSKRMIEILRQNVVNESGIPTIITTHSPTTVITTEATSIYEQTRNICIPQRISKQKAIELLSIDIPFLKISTEKRRQVFVESKYDVKYYEQLTNILSQQEELLSEPIFIPARTSNGSNCTDVINVVQDLSNNGNDQIYGIIDWDLENDNENKIIVLGQGERYAIENFLLDPLLMGLLFFREYRNRISFTNVSFNNYFEISKLTKIDAQNIINNVLNDLELNSENLLSYKTENEWELNITKEFCEYQGHDLETLYKSKYHFLNSYNREDKLKLDIIDKIINDLPNFTPKTIFDTIRKIK